MNLGTLINNVILITGFGKSADERTFLIGKANEGVGKVLLHTRCKVKIDSLDLTAGEADYEMPAAVLDLAAVTITGPDGSEIPLEPMQPDDIIEHRRFSATGGGQYPLWYGLEGDNVLMIYPTPESTGQVTFHYVPAQPSPMVDDSNDPSADQYGSVPTKFHDVIEAYVKWKAADADDDTSSQIGLQYMKEYQQLLADAKGRINRRVRWANARIGRKRARPTWQSPGVDYSN